MFFGGGVNTFRNEVSPVSFVAGIEDSTTNGIDLISDG